jgi:hypothetical protein
MVSFKDFIKSKIRRDGSDRKQLGVIWVLRLWVIDLDKSKRFEEICKCREDNIKKIEKEYIRITVMIIVYKWIYIYMKVWMCIYYLFDHMV